MLAQLVGGAAAGTFPDAQLASFARAIRIPESSTFHFSVQRREFGELGVMMTTQSAARVSGAELAQTESLCVGYMLSNSMRLGPRGAEGTAFGPGSAFAVTDWSAFEVSSAEPTRCLVIHLPRSRLHERGIRVAPHRYIISGSASLRAPLLSFALGTVHTGWTPSAIGLNVAERTIEDLIVGMFLESEGYAMDSEELRVGLRGRAITEIDSGHRDPDLNPTGVAARLGVSLRHLQRAFEDSGTSVTTELSRRRAASAALLLGAPGATELTIAEIASCAGFRSSFELRSAFKTNYRSLPSDYRAHAEGNMSYAPEAV
ncbi:helix-turn-helix domain-containing protein [Glaciibacter sp. 2TAF33]|uniref:helix-turn-helix domain-containing protein n=1 Tax=Glaciibacter sp. 2TAF33 TaxID=3233015 RepID=UPI003F915BC6